MHSLLKRQLKRYAGNLDTGAGEYRQFIDEVNQAYVQFDDDRTMLERSLELSSQELLQANSEMRAILQALPDLYFVLKEDGTILDCKGGQSVDFLLPPQQLLGKKIQDVPQGAMARIFEDAIQRVRTTNEMVNVEYVFVNGETHYYEARLLPLQNTKIMAVIRNISANKHAETELAEQRAFLRQIIDLVPDFIFAKDREGRFTLVNQVVAEAYGTTVEALTGKTDADFNPNSAEVEHFRKVDLDVMDSKKEKFVREEVITDAHKNVHWLQTIKRPILSADGTAQHVLGVSTDITERKRAEQELETSLSLLQATLESTADGILVVDAVGKIRSFNRKFVEMWHIPDAVLAAQDDGKALTFVLEQLKDPDAFLQKVHELYAKPELESFDILEFKDGRIFERYSQSQFIGGKSVGRVWSFRDITERKKLEDQLRHSQKMEGIGTLAGGIAHDFNNILGIIMGYASTMENKRNGSPEVALCHNAIMKASERGASLVRQMLTFARKTDVRFEPVNVNSVVKELKKMLEYTFPRTIDFKVSLDERLPLIIADHNQIHQALLNLCVNAKDAMSGNGTITIRTDVIKGSVLQERIPNADARQYVSIRVADTGHGMDEVTRSRVFEPFFTTKGLGEGTGLGLAVAYGIANSHRGIIDVRSEVGKGATFSLYFPVAPQEVVEAVDRVDDETEIPRGNETILVVEDEELLRNLLKIVFEGKGYEVLTAQDGLEAVEIYAEHQHEVALVLADMGLPKLNGREAYKSMKAMNPDVKVIIASGYLSPHLRADLLQDGAKDFIQKPYIPTDVLRKARVALSS